jgi:hypothetical protein
MMMVLLLRAPRHRVPTGSVRLASSKTTRARTTRSRARYAPTPSLSSPQSVYGCRKTCCFFSLFPTEYQGRLRTNIKKVTKRTGKPGCNTITCTSSAHGGKFHYFCFYCKGNRNSSLYLCGRSRACDRIKGSLDALRCCVTAGAGEIEGGDGYCTRELSGVECPQRIGGRTRSDVVTERSFKNARAPIDLCGDCDD